MSSSSGEYLRMSRKRCAKVPMRRMLSGCAGVAALMVLIAAQPIQATEPDDLAAQLQAASALHKQADYAHSIPLLKRIVQKSPQNYMANLLLGVDLLRSGSAKDALVPLRAASAERPDDGAPQAYLAEAGLALGDLAMATEAFESAVARSGGEEQYLMSWAGFCLDRFHVLEMSFLATKRGEGAELRIEAWGHPEANEPRETLLKQSAAADPEQRGIWGELGAEQLALGHLEQAVESLKQAGQRDPQGAETAQLEALLAAADKNWQEAGSSLAALGARSPAELQRVLGSWPAALTPGPEAVGAVWDCLRNPKAPCAPLIAAPQGGEGLNAQQLYAEGRWEQLKALTPPAPGDESGWLWRGVALARTGECSHAIPALERGLKADEHAAGFWLQACYASEEAASEDRLGKAGNLVALHQLRGDVALRLRYDPAAAQMEYAEALKARPRDPHLLASQAEAYKMLGDTAKARGAALAALAVNPRMAPPLQTLAEMAMSERDYDEALTRLKQLAVLQPRDAWTQVEMGLAYEQLGNPAQAVRCLGPQLAAGYPDKKGALHAQLASALRKLGRDAEAKQAAAEASRLANASLESGERGSGNAPQ